MTEPVAYLNKYLDGSTDITRFKPSNEADVVSLSSNVIVSSTPLYTSEQLYPRVKMTQKQYDRLMWEKSHTNLLACIDYFFEQDDNYKFGLSSENLRGDLTQTDIARAWLHPEETIEIVPDMKWFVRSKKPEGEDDDEYYLFLSGSNLDDLDYLVFDYAKTFDTKEQAELWTNPLTEAVKLPVEGE
ncbi:hypothetical protein [Leuconostoc mesenteroides]|uniref:hypothetical protein n=1 Tax=Leuconostoc mesenteroides TaxID=1245 RepID=UPI00235E34CD|nr:hypothetical protein [Leuconostoc mesenteroides]